MNIKKSFVHLKLLSTIVSIFLLSSGCKSEVKQATQPPALAVKVERISSTSLINSQQYVGILEAVNRVQLAPKTNGRIIKIDVAEGDTVTQGATIAVLEPTQQEEQVFAAESQVEARIASLQGANAELRQRQSERDSNKAEIARLQADLSRNIAQLRGSEADLKRAEADYKLAQVNHERSKSLVKDGVLPKQDLDNKTRDLQASLAAKESQKKATDAFLANVKSSQEAVNIAVLNVKTAEERIKQAIANVKQAEALVNEARGQKGSTQQDLKFNIIQAPINGIVGDFNQKKLGDFVNIGEVLTTITNNEELNLNINIPTENLSRLRLGIPCEIVNSDGSAGARGVISYIAPLINQQNQSVLVKMTFQNDGTLKDEQYVKVRVIWDTQPGFLVPTTAVSSLGGQKFVFVAKSGESNALVARQVPIKVGTIQGQSYQVMSGLQAGDEIIVSRILDLQNNLPIRIENEQSGKTN